MRSAGIDTYSEEARASCITCHRAVGGKLAKRSAGGTLAEPDHCAWCSRGVSEVAQEYERALSRKHTHGSLESCRLTLG